MDVKKMFSLEGKKGFITGGAQGIGKCLTNAFAELGAEVAIVDVNAEKAKAAAEEISKSVGCRVLSYGCDVTNPDSVDEMLDKFIGDFHEINFAVNNAGICSFDPAYDISPDSFEKVIDVNLTGIFYTARAAARRMKEQGKGGSIVSTASMSAKIVNVPQTIAAYCASKAGVEQLTKSLAVEWAQDHIRVNCVSPGYIQTELVAGLTDMLPVWQARMPEGSRLGYPEDLIGAYVYFASDASLFATGSNLAVDGGYTCL